MKLHIRNIAKIEKADIEINGITVIAGENNTGKSTVGKILYCLYIAFHNLDEKILNQRRNSIKVALIMDSSFEFQLRYALTSVREKSRNQLIDELDIIVDKLLAADSKEIEKILWDELKVKNNDSIQDIKDAIYISDAALKEIIIKEVLSQEFKGQVKPLYKSTEDSIIELSVKDSKISVDVSHNYKVKNEVNLNKECIIIDNPFVIDEMKKAINADSSQVLKGQVKDYVHSVFLNNKLSRSLKESNKNNLIKKFYLEERMDKFKKDIVDIIGGDINEEEDRFVFHDNGLDKDLDLRNLSAGMKTFAILLKLLENGDIQDGSIIVLDEPEIHLHPSWQLKFAELLVLLQKEFDLNIVLATHSPYFMNALQVYSAKYAIAHKTKYYLAELNEKGKAVFEDVTLDPEKVYKLLAQPFQLLEDEEEQE